jgi:hypothetical protein
MALSKAMLDELTAGYKTPQELESLYAQMLQHMINRALEGEMQARNLPRQADSSKVELLASW